MLSIYLQLHLRGHKLWVVLIQKSTKYRDEGDKALIGKEGNFGGFEVGKWKRKKKRRYPLPLFFL
jgi:hypothetical protein